MLYYTYKIEVAMKCRCYKCGAKLVKDANYCGECGSKIDKNEKIEDGNWKYYLLINAILIFCAFFLSVGNKYMLPAALIVLITAKIKYPKNTVVSVIFWLELILYIVLVILLAVLMVACIKSCTKLV